MKLRNVYDDDVIETAIPLLYRLLQQRPARANISHHSMPSFDEHVAFVCRVPYAHWYLIEVATVHVGAVYLSGLREIGIGILAEHQGHGLARQAICLLMEQHPGDPFLANVAPGNLRSHRLFQSLGFEVIQHTYRHP